MYGAAAAWWLMTVFIALAFLTAYPAGEGMLYLSDSVAVAAIIMGIAAWREKSSRFSDWYSCFST